MAGLRPAPAFSRLLVTAGFAVLLAAVCWLLFVIDGHHAGMVPLAQVENARLELMAAADPALTLDQVRALPDSAWQPWTAKPNDYQYAPHGKVIWLRIRFRNATTARIEGMLSDPSFFSDVVEAWTFHADGSRTHAIAGDAVPGTAKRVWSRTAAFPLIVPRGGDQLSYWRVSDRYQALIQPLFWQREEDFYAAAVRETAAECLCFGGLAALVIYNLVLWARLRFRDLGFYVLSAAAATVTNFTALGGPGLLGLATGSPWHEMMIAGSFSLGGLCMLEFTRSFLDTHAILPRLDRVFRVWRLVPIACALGTLAMPWMDTPAWVGPCTGFAMLNDLICVLAAVLAWRQGVRHARFFVFAYGALLAANLPVLVSVLSGRILAGSILGLLAGRTMEMLLLSFAISDRFAQTQRQLLTETEQRRAVEEAYADELELEVKERTGELARANADKDRMLSVIGHDLRSPLTGLMKSADQPAAEFARETKHTCRALLLMIEDLVLWARMRAGSRDFGLHPARALLQPAVALHRTLADQGGTTLRVDVPAELQVETDLVLAQTLVRNLLANALKFARTEVVLRIAQTDAGLRLTIANDGPSLPDDIVRRLAADEAEPMTAIGGLGLRLCREICAALHTRLEARVPHGGGSEFAFVLPGAVTATEEPA